MKFTVEIKIMPLAAIPDNIGDYVCNSLNKMGFTGINSAKIGKSIILEVDAVDKEEAYEHGHKACRELLCNESIEEYSIEVKE